MTSHLGRGHWDVTAHASLTTSEETRRLTCHQGMHYQSPILMGIWEMHDIIKMQAHYLCIYLTVRLT